MPDKIDMGLDEIIKNKKTTRGARGGGGRGGGLRRGGGIRPRGGFNAGGSFNRRGGGGASAGFAAGGGGIRKRRSGGPIKPNTFKSAMRLSGGGDEKWTHDLYNEAPRRTSGGAGGGFGPTRVQITNLDYGVNDKDIKDLFEEFGIRKAAIHYDRTGRSLGTADVLFEKKADAVRAIKEYNGVQLDGRPMNIQLAPSSSAPTSAASAGAGAGPRSRGTRRFGFGGRGRGGPRGRGRGGRGGGMGNRINKGPAKTKEQLDADLDTYASMQTD